MGKGEGGGPGGFAAPAVDSLVYDIAGYVDDGPAPREQALETAWLALFDALGCAMAATRVPGCMALVGPVVPGAVLDRGVRIPGTAFRVDPVMAAFGTACLIRWLDFSDSWVALESGHPSDNTGAVLAAAEFESRRRRMRGEAPLVLQDVLRALVRAYEIQGVLGLSNSLGRRGFDHVTFVRVASAAIAAKLLGGDRRQIASAVSHAWCDGHPLRIYRQGSHTGSRKSWAGPDAAARGVQLALWSLRGEPPCGTVLTDPAWGMAARLFSGRPLTFSRPLSDHVMRNILFKVSYPGVIHAQTALEAAIRLHPDVRERLGAVERIEIWSHDRAIRTASKVGPLRNAADRDHCLQYMVAVGLIKGDLVEDDFLDVAAGDARIDWLRARMVVREDPRFTAGSADSRQGSSANGVQVFFGDGSGTPRLDVEYPLGHARRRAAGLPLLEKKLRRNLAVGLASGRTESVMRVFSDRERHVSMDISEFMDLFDPGSDGRGRS